MDTQPIKWRTEPALRGLQSALQRDINGCTDGAYVSIDYGTACALIDVLKQARHSEIKRLELA